MSGRRRATSPQEVSLADRLRLEPAAAPTGARQRERARRRERDRRRRRVVGIVAVVAAVAVGAGVLVPLLLRSDGAPPNTPPATERTQQTMVLAVATVSGPILSAALLGADGTTDEGAVVLVPSRLIVDGPSPEGIQFGATARLPDLDAPAFALGETLGVVVDGTWKLTPPGLTRLVDAVGGITINVDEDVVRTFPNGNRRLLVPAGTNTLNGVQAAAYATLLAARDPEPVRLAHFNDVLLALLPKLPKDPVDLQKLLTRLGADSRMSRGSAWLASFLLTLAGPVQQRDVVSQTLPVAPLDVGGPTTIYTVDEDPARQLLDRSFADSLPPGGNQRTSVLVQNGVGRPELVDAAARKLTANGYAFVNGGNANRFGYRNSVVVVPDGSDQSVTAGGQVAKALGLPASSVQVASVGQNVADVLVILGADFRP